MNLKHLESFLAVVRAGGFRQAAQVTGLSQPALSQHLQKLERELGGELIERHHNGCSPTPAGTALVSYAEIMLRIADRARALFDRGTLSIGASSNIGIYLLQPFLRAYRDLYPQDAFEVVVDRNPAISERLSNAGVDVALMEWWDDRPGFTGRLWRRDELVVIVPPSHSWAQRDEIPSTELVGCELLAGESGSGTWRIVQSQLGPIADSISVSITLGSTEAVKRAVEAGLGISLVLASCVTDELASGRLKALRVQGVRLQKSLFICHHSDLPTDGRARRFADFLLAQDRLASIRRRDGLGACSSSAAGAR
jgi:DNA-binding transcriptional LysR family regulator